MVYILMIWLLGLLAVVCASVAVLALFGTWLLYRTQSHGLHSVVR